MHDGADVVFRNGGDQHPRRALVLDQVVGDGVDRVLAALGRERADRAAGMTHPFA